MGLGSILGGIGSLFGGGDSIPKGTPGIGDGGLGAGSPDPLAIGKALAPLGGALAPSNQSGEAGIMDLMNREKLSLNRSLAGGQGVDNAQDMLKGLLQNALFSESATGKGLMAGDPEKFNTIMQARAGEGPGGGFGVTSNTQEFLKENDPGLEFMADAPLWKKVLGGAAKVGGGLAAPFTGGASLIAGDLASQHLTKKNRKTFEQ